MLPLYFLFIFLSSFILADIAVFPIIDIGMSMYAVDIIYLYIFISFFYVCVNPYVRLYKLNKWFLSLIFAILFAILYGVLNFKFSALGEGRTVYWIFFFAVPLYFYHRNIIHTLKSFDKLFKISYIVISVAVLVLLVIELINGGRFFFTAANQEFANLESDRGIRYLGSEETFNLGVVVVFLLIGIFINKKQDVFRILLITFLLVIIFFTKNRTALLSLFLSLVYVFTTEGKGKLIIKLSLSLVLFLGLCFLFFPTFTLSIISPITSAFNVTEDETGSWRLLVQAVAIQQGLETPILGQGFGGYYNYFIESLDMTIEYPPHSIYVLFFQKGGLLLLSVYIIAVISLIRQCSLLKKYTRDNIVAERYRIFFKVLFVAQIPYGFAYNFSLYFGLYIGFFFVLREILKRKTFNNLSNAGS